MKKTTLVWMFAACAGALAAQGQQSTKVTASQEIAKIVAVEEQERDLAKAETLYREALAGKELSGDARVLANRRLGALLVRLGREQDAAPFVTAGKAVAGNAGFDDFGPTPQQEREREAALREKARDLVTSAHHTGAVSDQNSPLFGIHPQVAEQLLWIGEPAVPEVIAYLADKPAHSLVARGLGALLWRVGGAKAEAFLRQSLDAVQLRGDLARAACAANSEPMLAIAAEYMRLQDPGFPEAILDEGQWGPPLRDRLASALLVDVMGKGSVAQQLWLLKWSRSAPVTPEAMPKLLEVVRGALAGTEPSLGTAAQNLLFSNRRSNDVGVMELLLDWLPSPLLAGRTPSGTSAKITIDAERARRWLPKIDACIKANGPWRNDLRSWWLVSMVQLACEPLDAAVVPMVLRWQDLGYPCWQVLRGKVTAANAAEVFARFERVEDTHKYQFLNRLFSDLDLPAELFPAMRAQADALEAKKWGPMAAFVMPMVRTGNPDAAAWIVAGWQRDPKRCEQEFVGLVELGRRSQDEKVRAAMRTMARAESTLQAQRVVMIFELLAMHDPQALDLVYENAGRSVRSDHPYGGKDTFTGKPLAWLVQKDAKPPHGYAESDVLKLLARLGQTEAGQQALSPHEVGAQLITDGCLKALPSAMPGSFSINSYSLTWARALVSVVEERGADDALSVWLAQSVGSNQLTGQIILDLPIALTRRFEPQLRALLDADEPWLAVKVLERLEAAGIDFDVKALLRHRNAGLRRVALERHGDRVAATSFSDVLRLLSDSDGGVRRIACGLAGERVAKEAVPALIAALRDVDGGVRQEAEKALTKIRFFHEQQAHWDRVLKGLDASPASAAEKLLLQAKPGAPKEQRLLAITSLGTLGVPEALPFLIDWAQDADAAVAKAAKDAITQIHLNPRK